MHDPRDTIRALLDVESPADAPTAYYALYHDPERTNLHIHPSGHGFVARCTTGIDLFRPLVTLRCPSHRAAADLFEEALIPHRPYLLFASVSQIRMLGNAFRFENQQVHRIYQMDPAHFQPVLNRLVRCRITENGKPLSEIKMGGLRAISGLNWQSPTYAEVYVFTEQGARRRGWGRSVLLATTEIVLESGRTPLYLAEADNNASIWLAEGAGYVDTGARQIFAEVVYEGGSDG